MDTDRPSPPNPVALMRRMQARIPEAQRNTPGQHVISQTLLRRFTTETPGNARALLKLDLHHDPVRSRISGPAGSGKIRDFVPYASTSLEAFWSQIETHFPATLKAVDDGTLFDPGVSDRLSVVRDIAALHFVRTAQIKRNHHEAFELALAAQKEFWRRRPQELYRFYRARTGVIAHTPGAIERILTLLFEDNVARVMSGATLREQMENHYEKVRSVLEKFNVQIWRPAHGAGEFLIGDSPAVLFDPHTEFVGAAASFGLLEADVALLMPLGPWCMAYLHRGPQTGYQQAPADVVERANAAQILAAEANVFARLDTGFESFADHVLKHGGYPLSA